MTAPTELDVDALAQEIRRIDGSNSLGAGALAEALMPFLAALPASEAGWRDMESAPKDGTKFDAWVPDAFGGHRMTCLSFNQKGKLRRHGLLADAELPRWPTHWMPLPSAPDRRPA